MAVAENSWTHFVSFNVPRVGFFFRALSRASTLSKTGPFKYKRFSKLETPLLVYLRKIFLNILCFYGRLLVDHFFNVSIVNM